MIQFEKVEKSFFLQDCEDTELPYGDFFEECYDEIRLPERSTSGSAGYDIRTPIPFSLHPGSSIVIPTGVKIHMNKFNVLLVFMRSGLAIRHGLYLLNGTGIIDSDYADNRDNDGDILLAIGNQGKRTFRAEAGDRIAQGIIVHYFPTDEDDVVNHRKGGIGSTGV